MAVVGASRILPNPSPAEMFHLQNNPRLPQIVVKGDSSYKRVTMNEQNPATAACVPLKCVYICVPKQRCCIGNEQRGQYMKICDRKGNND